MGIAFIALNEFPQAEAFFGGSKNKIYLSRNKLCSMVSYQEPLAPLCVSLRYSECFKAGKIYGFGCNCTYLKSAYI